MEDKCSFERRRHTTLKNLLRSVQFLRNYGGSGLADPKPADPDTLKKLWERFSQCYPLSDEPPLYKPENDDGG